MNIEIITLCDASTSDSGKLNILGAFDTINVSSLPATHPFCSLALRFKLSREENGKHFIRIVFNDPDNKEFIKPYENEVDTQITEDFVSLNSILNLVNIKFSKPGVHSVIFNFDKKERYKLPFLVKIKK